MWCPRDLLEVPTPLVAMNTSVSLDTEELPSPPSSDGDEGATLTLGKVGVLYSALVSMLGAGIA